MLDDYFIAYYFSIVDFSNTQTCLLAGRNQTCLYSDLDLVDDYGGPNLALAM